MRKLKLQVQTTVDGYMAGPGGAMDWMTHPWTTDIEEYIDELTASVDCIVLGRRLAESFIPAWAAGPEGEDQASVDWMNNTPKVVVSDSLEESPWDNARVVGGDLTEAMNRLKAEPGGDLIVYGGSTLVTGLVARGLVDELHLFVSPTAVGDGLRVFPDDAGYQRLRLVSARPFDCGVTALHLEPQPA